MKKIIKRTEYFNGDFARKVETLEEVAKTMTKDDKVNQIIAMQDSMEKLLRELVRSKEFEAKQYHVFGDPVVNTSEYWAFNNFAEYRYFLYRISDGKQLFYGGKAKLKSFIKSRNIDLVNVFIDGVEL